MKEKYVKITRKILEYYPNWNSIIGWSGVIVEEIDPYIRIQILSDGRRHLKIIYTIPKDCTKPISKKEMMTEVL